MKKLLLLVLSLVLVFNLVITPAAVRKTDVYIDNQKSTAIDVTFIDGKPLMCIEEVYKYFGYDTSYTDQHTMGYYVEILKNGKTLFSYHYENSWASFVKKSSYTKFTTTGMNELGLSQYTPYAPPHKILMIEADENHHYVRVEDITTILNFEYTYDATALTFSLYDRARIPMMTVYSLDGRTKEILVTDEEAENAVGWYSTPPVIVYAPDGRQEIISINDLAAWCSVGWYTEPVVPVYAPDGRQEIIPSKNLNAWLSVGWSSEPFVTVYSADGRTLNIPTSQIEAYKQVGWYYNLPVYSPDGRVEWVLYPDYQDWLAVGWYAEEVTYMYSADDRTTIAPTSKIKEYQNAGWMTPSQYASHVQSKKNSKIYDFINNNRSYIEGEIEKFLKSIVKRPATLNINSTSITQHDGNIHVYVSFESANNKGEYSSTFATLDYNEQLRMLRSFVGIGGNVYDFYIGDRTYK